MEPRGTRPASRRRLSRRLAKATLLVGLSGILLWFMLTDRTPSVQERSAPTAAEVGAGRDAASQLRASRSDPSGRSQVDLGRAQLDGAAALASHGFRPDRLALEIRDGTASMRGSHHLPGGRWLNASLSTTGGGIGFPPTRITVGSMTLNPFLSRKMLQVGRRLLRVRHVRLPPLDEMVSDVAIKGGRVTATVRLPEQTGLIDGLVATSTQPAVSRLTTHLYCRLAGMQRSQPVAEFTDLLHRAFSWSDPSATSSEYNHAALIALAMLVVDERTGDLAGPARANSERCRVALIPVTIYGRSDWPKHWVLSAALAAGAGTQISEAMGEWKELADSLSKQSQFARGDPSGFSFADLSADRSGFRSARAAIDPARADRTAAWLRTVTAEHLLPRQLTEREDGLTNAEFGSRYGSLADQRFSARVGEIDRALYKVGVPN
jgi:hypothetical protein